MNESYSASYAAAGVDITAGYRAVELMKQHVARTMTAGMTETIGGFGGLFQLDTAGMAHPCLVSGTDGVGTKIRIAQLMDRHDTIGIDCVAMCVNDVICCGAKPLFFLDYIACGKNYPERIAQIVSGIAEGCRQAGCALVGGETAEMPGMYAPEDYDIAGFTVGAVEKDELIDGSKVAEGDVLVGIPSTGVHSNGFSLVRKIVADADLDLAARYPETGDKTLGETLLTPTAIYVRPVLAMMKAADVHGVAHITGGGFDENIPRILGEGLGAEIEEGSWEILPVFRLLERCGGIPHREMFNIFNMGIGMVVALSETDVPKALESLQASGLKPSVIGKVVKGNGVTIK